ncbi:hypothetical protein V2G26_009863 [Clonostachys chloroleuca]
MGGLTLSSTRSRSTQGLFSAAAYGQCHVIFHYELHWALHVHIAFLDHRLTHQTPWGSDSCQISSASLSQTSPVQKGPREKGTGLEAEKKPRILSHPGPPGSAQRITDVLTSQLDTAQSHFKGHSTGRALDSSLRDLFITFPIPLAPRLLPRRRLIL